MIEIRDKTKCCGCTACVNVCPKNCIIMKEDNEGFLYPYVNIGVCINCQLCEKVCPILNNKEEVENHNQKAAIVASRDKEILRQSTSGGAFTAIAEYVIKQGGIVFGVEMQENFKVRHICIQNSELLYKFRNSKYVQSDLGKTFLEVKKQLETGRIVCFSGTPCQIEGLLNYLVESYENLILVDVVCRSVPSPGVWKKYTEWLTEKYGDIKSIRFRDKTLGYQFSTMEVVPEKGNVIRNGIESDLWLRMFFSGMIIRPSCSKCKFRKRYRRSDFTIWDCFNVADLTSDIDEKLGATRVLIHSEKGAKIFDNIKDKYDYIECKAESLVEGMRELSISPRVNPNKNEFFMDFHCLGMEELMNKWFPMTITIRAKKLGRLALNYFGVDILVKKIKRKMKG